MNDLTRRWLRLAYDDRVPFGSQQHYFHFVWGYLLPALDRILTVSEGEKDVGFELASCGPAMDPRLQDVARWLDVPLRIASARDDGERVERQEYVERWDEWLRGRVSIRIGLASGLHRCGWKHRVLSGIERVRAFVLARALFAEPGAAARKASELDSMPEEGRGEWLLLRRSEEPSFYRVGGPAEKPTYGVTRRSIANLEDLCAELLRRGLPVRIYEPGLDDLARQVRTYHGAAGVIGIRGAELANIVWMRPGRGVVMLVTPVKRENNVARHIALVRGLRARPIPVESDHPFVSADTVLRAVDSAA